ncbi:hypothetical protein KKG29_01825 [Patescibacteria group bacterium]|nr:hypothetical protein [Patescibacteria group bacterium]MBU4368692.1 hypothetical protein [Patescibacteria group bacterium]
MNIVWDKRKLLVPCKECSSFSTSGQVLPAATALLAIRRRPLDKTNHIGQWHRLVSYQA